MLQPYRGWSITWDYGYYTATGPDYDAWTDGEGEWTSNGQSVQARTLPDLYLEVDSWIEENVA